MKVTIKDIANHLNMNYSTVSYALRDKGSIKKDTRELIKRTAEELGYVPNKLARQICTGKSNSVALLVPNVLFEYGEFCEHAFRILSEAGFLTNISITEFSPERELHIIRELIGQRVAGIIMIPTFDAVTNRSKSGAINLINKHNIPLVYRGVDVDGHAAAVAAIEYEQIGKTIGKKFKEAGRKRVCLAVPHPPPFSNNVTGIMAGVTKVYDEDCVSIEYLENKNIIECSDYFKVNDHYENQMRGLLGAGGVDAGRQMFRQLYSDSEKSPDAFICPHEFCAVGMLLEARDNGIKVPEQFSIASGQRSLLGTSSPQPISSAYVSMPRLATEMVGMMLEFIKTGEAPENVWITPEFFSGTTI